MYKHSLQITVLCLFFNVGFGQVVKTDSFPVQSQSLIDSIAGISIYNQAFSEINTANIPSNGNLQVLSLVQNRNASLVINNNSGSPGASMNSIIRGRNSFFNTASPLYVLDGLPIDNSEWNNVLGGTDQSNRLIDINPYNIESVEVLSGPVATALYGMRGSNGVVLLSSKSGRSGKPQINISSDITMSKVGQLPKRQSEFAQGAFSNGQYVYRGPETFEGDSWGPAISTLEFDGNPSYLFDKGGRLVPIGSGNGVPAVAYDPYVFFQNAISYNLNASVRGGNNRLGYFISGGRNTVTGVIPKTDYTRNAIYSSLTYKASSKLNISASARFASSKANRSQTGSSLQGIMVGLTRNAPTFDITNGLSPSEAVNNSSAWLLNDGTQRSYRNGVYDNPYWSINNNPHLQNTNRIIGQTQLEYSVTDDLIIDLSGGIDRFTDERSGGIDINPNFNGGSAYNRKQEFASSNIDLKATWLKDISDKFKMQLQLGSNYFQWDVENNLIEGTGLLISGDVDILNVTNISNDLNSYRLKDLGVYSSANLSYDNFVDLNFSVRQDYSSSLGSDQNSFLSYGINTNFNFLNLINPTDDAHFFSALSLNLGYGVTGSPPPPDAAIGEFVPTIISGDGFLGVTTLDGTLERSEIDGNKNLKAEKTSAFEIGIQSSFLDNRVSFQATYYTQITSDVILLRQITPSSGFNFIYDNLAEISNKGIELSLRINPIKTDKFSWTTGVFFNNNKNVIEKIPFKESTNNNVGGFNSTYTSFIEGEAYGTIIGTGFEKDGNGNLIIGMDGFPIFERDQIIANPNPNFTLGLDNTFSIGKKLTLGILIDIRNGGEMYCGTCGIMNYLGISELSAEERNTTITFPGITPNGSPNTQMVNLTDPSTGESGFYRRRYGFGGVNGDNVFDTSWIRLRRISINYQFSIPALEMISLGLYADNILLSTNYPGIDPETNLTGNSNNYGFDYFNNPSTQSFGISLNLTL